MTTTKEKTVSDLGYDDADLTDLALRAKRKAKIPETKRAKGRIAKFSTAVWSIMQQDPKFGMSSEDQLVVLKAIIDKETLWSPEPAVSPSAIAEKREEYVNRSISDANSSNPH